MIFELYDYQVHTVLCSYYVEAQFSYYLKVISTLTPAVFMLCLDFAFLIPSQTSVHEKRGGQSFAILLGTPNLVPNFSKHQRYFLYKILKPVSHPSQEQD